MGIEPTSSAWKAEVLPLNYTRAFALGFINPGTSSLVPENWWRGKDSNLRRLSQQIYSLPPLAAREPLLMRTQARYSVLVAILCQGSVEDFFVTQQGIFFARTPSMDKTFADGADRGS